MAWYSAAWKSPSGFLPATARRALATATSPAHCGAPMLVPPNEFQLVVAVAVKA